MNNIFAYIGNYSGTNTLLCINEDLKFLVEKMLPFLSVDEIKESLYKDGAKPSAEKIADKIIDFLGNDYFLLTDLQTAPFDCNLLDFIKDDLKWLMMASFVYTQTCRSAADNKSKEPNYIPNNTLLKDAFPIPFYPNKLFRVKKKYGGKYPLSTFLFDEAVNNSSKQTTQLFHSIFDIAPVTSILNPSNRLVALYMNHAKQKDDAECVENLYEVPISSPTSILSPYKNMFIIARKRDKDDAKGVEDLYKDFYELADRAERNLRNKKDKKKEIENKALPKNRKEIEEAIDKEIKNSQEYYNKWKKIIPVVNQFKQITSPECYALMNNYMLEFFSNLNFLISWFDLTLRFHKGNDICNPWDVLLKTLIFSPLIGTRLEILRQLKLKIPNTKLSSVKRFAAETQAIDQFSHQMNRISCAILPEMILAFHYVMNALELSIDKDEPYFIDRYNSQQYQLFSYNEEKELIPNGKIFKGRDDSLPYNTDFTDFNDEQLSEFWKFMSVVLKGFNDNIVNKITQFLVTIFLQQKLEKCILFMQILFASDPNFVNTLAEFVQKTGKFTLLEHRQQILQEYLNSRLQDSAGHFAISEKNEK